MNLSPFLSGPMTGIPQHNLPAFDAATRNLRARGYHVINPVELDGDEARERLLRSEDGTMSDTEWAECLGRDTALIAAGYVDSVIVLPGWQHSCGARMETFIARLTGLPIYHYGPRDPLRRVARSHLELVHSLKEAT